MHVKIDCLGFDSHRERFTWRPNIFAVTHYILFAFLKRRRWREAGWGRVGQFSQRQRRGRRAAEPAVRADGLLVEVRRARTVSTFSGTRLTGNNQLRNSNASESGEMLHWLLGMAGVDITHTRARCRDIGRFSHHAAFDLEDHWGCWWIYPD